MGQVRQTFSPFYPLLIVLIAVILNVFSAVLLKSLADASSPAILWLLGGILLAVIINCMRFLVWGYALKRYPLSNTYPLASIFFPVMLVVSYLYGEPVSMNQILGTLLILCGVVTMSMKTG